MILILKTYFMNFKYFAFLLYAFYLDFHIYVKYKYLWI